MQPNSSLGTLCKRPAGARAHARAHIQAGPPGLSAEDGVQYLGEESPRWPRLLGFWDDSRQIGAPAGPEEASCGQGQSQAQGGEGGRERGRKR